jgi:hypothetical protein
MGRQMSTRNDSSSNAASMVVEWSNPNCAAAVAVLSGSRPNITTSTSPRAAYAAAWAWPNPVPNRAIFMIIVPFELDGYMVRSVRQRRRPRVSISATSAALRVSSRAWQFSEIRSG